jgi:cell division septation protein DedD
MQRKNKLMLIAAVGAVLVLVALSVVRCAVTRAADQADAQNDAPAIEQPAQSQEATQVNDETKQVADTLSILRDHAWQVEGDATKTITFREGSFVETDGTSTRVTAFTLKADETSSDQRTLTVEPIRDDLAAGTTGIITISGKEGAYVLASDTFAVAKTYVQGAASNATIQVKGTDAAYLQLVDDRGEDLSRALAEYCRNLVPTATTVTFDGEVYLDTKAHRVMATFHCNDAASTILTATYASGTFTVTG